MIQYLHKITTQQLWIALAITSLASVSLILLMLGPLIDQSYKSKHNLVQLQQELENDTPPAERLIQVQAEVKRLDLLLNGELADLPAEQIESFVIGELQNISWEQDINLIGVVPTQGLDISIFSEHLFQIKLTGNFFEIANWLSSVRDRLGFVVVKQFTMQPTQQAGGGWTLQVDLTMASYRYKDTT